MVWQVWYILPMCQTHYQGIITISKLIERGWANPLFISNFKIVEFNGEEIDQIATGEPTRLEFDIQRQINGNYTFTKLAIIENAESYLSDAEMYISNNKTDHLAIPIEFAMEEIGKAKIIFDKIENNSKILLSNKDGIYSHKTKVMKVISLIELDIGDKIAEALLLGDDDFNYLLDPIVISSTVKKENELKNYLIDQDIRLNLCPHHSLQDLLDMHLDH